MNWFVHHQLSILIFLPLVGAVAIASMPRVEAGRIRWDVSWIWGPPEDHLAQLFRTVGRERFVLGTHFPLRLPEAALTKLELTQ